MFTLMMGNMTNLGEFVNPTYVYKEGTLSNLLNKDIYEDAEENLGTSTGTVNISETTIDLGRESSPNYKLLMCQFNLNVNSTDTIEESYISFYANNGNNNDLTAYIFIEDTNNSSTVQTTNKNLSNRTYTLTTSKIHSDFVLWPALNTDPNVPSDIIWSVPYFTSGNTYNTPDLSTLINHVISKSNWSSGNRIGIGFIGHSGRRRIASDESSNPDPKLYYKVKGPDTQTIIPNNKIQDIPQSINVINYFEQDGFLGSGGEPFDEFDTRLEYSDTDDYANYLINVTESGTYMFKYLVSGNNTNNDTGQLIMTLFNLSYEQIGSILETITFDTDISNNGITGDWSVFSLRPGSQQFQLSIGKYILQLKVGTQYRLDIKGLEVIKLDSTDINSTPVLYKVQTVPGKIEAEDFYNVNQINIYYDGSETKLADTTTGDYVEYIINVTESRFYSLKYNTTSVVSGSGTLITKLYDTNYNSISTLETITINTPSTLGDYIETNGSTNTYISSGTYILRVAIGTETNIHINWIELVGENSTLNFSVTGDLIQTHTGSALSIIISPDNDTVPWSINNGTEQTGDQTYSETNTGTYDINLSVNNEYITVSPTSYTFEIKEPAYRYFKFEILGTSNISDINIRHIKIMNENYENISFTATGMVSGWSNLSNLTSNNTSHASHLSGSASFRIDCGSSTDQYRYEVWSQTGDNPNRIPIKWDVSGSHDASNWTFLHRVDLSQYKHGNKSNNSGWDWRTYNSNSEWSGMTQHMEVDDNGTIIQSNNANYRTGLYKVLWCTTSSHGDYTNESDILCPQYSRFLRSNFGNNDNTIDTFLLQ